MLPVVQVERGARSDDGGVVPLVADAELVATDERNHHLVRVRAEVDDEPYGDLRMVGVTETPQLVPGSLADAFERGRVVGSGNVIESGEGLEGAR